MTQIFVTTLRMHSLEFDGIGVQREDSNVLLAKLQTAVKILQQTERLEPHHSQTPFPHV